MHETEQDGGLASIRCAPEHGPFVLKHIINDIVRTQYCVPGSTFLVEGIDIVPVSKMGRWQVMRLLLGDGDLCIQALLGGPMHRFVESQEVSVGCYVKTESFSVKWHEASMDERNLDLDQKMVYLVLDDLATIGWNVAYHEMWLQQQEEAINALADENDLDLEEMNMEYTEEEANKAQAREDDSTRQTGEPTTAPPIVVVGDDAEDEDDAALEDAFEAFEAQPFPPPESKTLQPTSRSSAAAKSSGVALPQPWQDHQTPLKLTTLYAIPHLPYKQNWSCNILAIVVSLSDIEPSHLSPYRQRTARLADPSTAKRVHLTVFLGPEGFTPEVGSAVLLVGVKNHRFDGGSLKKYASDKGKGEWWFENPSHLNWCDVDGIKRWWTGVQTSASEA